MYVNPIREFLHDVVCSIRNLCNDLIFAGKTT